MACRHARQIDISIITEDAASGKLTLRSWRVAKASSGIGFMLL